jgi:hypothetical protein
MNVKDHVNNNQKVIFQFYRSGVLYYKTEQGLIFEVPVSDCGDAVFNREDRAMYFMRWIRKEIEAINAAMAIAKKASAEMEELCK